MCSLFREVGFLYSVQVKQDVLRYVSFTPYQVVLILKESQASTQSCAHYNFIRNMYALLWNNHFSTA